MVASVSPLRPTRATDPLSRIPPAPRVPSLRAQQQIFRRRTLYVVIGALGWSVVVVTAVFFLLRAELGQAALALPAVVVADLGVAAFLWLRHQKKVEAFARGTPILAQVLSRHAASQAGDLFRIRYAFALGGKSFSGVALFSPDQAPELTSDQIPVLYAPRSPNTNVPFLD